MWSVPALFMVAWQRDLLSAHTIDGSHIIVGMGSRVVITGGVMTYGVSAKVG